MKILNIARIPHSKALCGSFLKLVTASGVIVLDDYDIYYDSDVGTLFAQSGLNPHAITSDESSGRRRRMTNAEITDNVVPPEWLHFTSSYIGVNPVHGSQQMRRLTSGGVTVSGLQTSSGSAQASTSLKCHRSMLRM